MHFEFFHEFWKCISNFFMNFGIAFLIFLNAFLLDLEINYSKFLNFDIIKDFRTKVKKAHGFSQFFFILNTLQLTDFIKLQKFL